MVFSVIPVFEAESDMPHDKNTTEGDTVTFTCNAKGKPEAEIQWFKNGVLTVSMHNDGKTVHTHSALLICCSTL